MRTPGPGLLLAASLSWLAACASSAFDPDGADGAVLDAAQEAPAASDGGGTAADTTVAVGGADGAVDTRPDDTATSGEDAAAADGAPASATCGGIACPQLFALAEQCPETGTCHYQATAVGTNFCFDSGVRSYVMGAIVGTRFELNTRFTRPDGTTCYTLETSAELNGGDQAVTWRDASGNTIATGVARGDQLTLTCNGATRVLPSTDCPGTRRARPETCAMASCP